MSRLPASLDRLLRRVHARWVRATSGTKLRVRGSDHTLQLTGAQLHGCTVEVNGEGNRLEIAPGAKLWGVKIEFNGSRLTCRIGANVRFYGGQFTLTDTGSRIEVGAQTTMFTPVIVAQEGSAVVVGNDCMFAYGVDLRSSDGHSILEAGTRRRINPPADLVIEDHVWIGIHSQVLKGVRIGRDAIVAARSVVTKPVPSGVVVAGNPAKVVREGVTWDRERI